MLRRLPRAGCNSLARFFTVSAAVLAVAGAPAWSDTLEDHYGDGQSSGCTANGTPIEQKILDRGSGFYSYPTTPESEAILAAVDALLERDAELAHAEAAAAGYRLNEFHDTDRNRVYHILEPAGSPNPGHGYFIFDLHGNRSILLEAPHVGFDTRTVDFALAALTAQKPFALLIPGADRYANYDCDGCSSPCELMSGEDNSDVTRTELNLFHQVHQRLLDRLTAECRRLLVVQFHGFGSSTQSKPGCGFDFILSDGDGERIVDPQHLTRLGETLDDHTNNGSGEPGDAYTWNVASGTGSDCPQLLATVNRQGATTRAAGSLFTHVEMDYGIRTWPDGADAAEIAAALAETLLGACQLSVSRGALPGEILLEWDGGLGDEILYRSPSAASFCTQAEQFPAPDGSFLDETVPGSFFYRVE
jgi:hypothetical protein